MQCLLLPVQKSIFNNTKFAIFGDKYLSQDLIVILRNITQLCQVRQRRRWRAAWWRPSRDRLLAFMNAHTAITRHSPNFALMLSQRRRRRASIRTTLGQCLMFAGLRSQLISNFTADQQTLSQLISKLESLTQCQPDGGPPFTTLGRH